MLLRVVYAAGLVVLIAGLQYLIGLSGSGVAVVAVGTLLSLLPFGVWWLFETEESSNLDLTLPPAAGTAGVLTGGVLRWAAASTELMAADLIATAICAVCGVAIIAARARRRQTSCPLHCGRSLAGGGRQCPRCDLIVCGHSSCWRKERYRCADCELLGRPLLPNEDDGWWVETLGQPVTDGTCQKCNRYAGSSTLYDCKHCHWPTCVRCWDEENGRCVRCGRTLPELPEDLLAHLGGHEEELQSSAHA